VNRLGCLTAYTEYVKGTKRQARRRSRPGAARARSAAAPASVPASTRKAAAVPRKPAQKRSWWRKVHPVSTLKLLAAFVIWLATVAAAVIGWASYNDQHQLAVNTITQQQQHDAQGVSFAQDDYGKGNVLGATIIENNSNAPVHYVVFDVGVVVFNDVPATTWVEKIFAFSLYDIPACSVGTTNITNTAFGEMLKLLGPHHFRYFVTNVGPMSFTDRYGVSWRYSTVGKLEQGPGLSDAVQTRNIAVPFKTSTGCS
jgi:hypothetical protein